MTQSLDPRESLSILTNNISQASRYFWEWILTDNEFSNPSFMIETSFLQLLALVEALQFNELHRMILSEYYRFKNSAAGFNSSDTHPDGEPYSVCLARIRHYLHVVQSFFPAEDRTRVTKDLLEIIRGIHYVITDEALFGHLPACENDVQIRIEGILRCVFPDLKHKPPLTKPIKNFEPDTGIASIQTLIEYKFLGNRKHVNRIADEVLADTRGYVSRDWNRFLYVIYETRRFRPEREWSQLLQQSGVSDNTSIVVLSGIPPAAKSMTVKGKVIKAVNSKYAKPKAEWKGLKK